jgi:hypothetical protein
LLPIIKLKAIFSRLLPRLALKIPVVDFTGDSPSTAQQIVSEAAKTTGLVHVHNLPHQPNFLAIQR